jgi:hypothetical protein
MQRIRRSLERDVRNDYGIETDSHGDPAAGPISGL